MFPLLSRLPQLSPKRSSQSTCLLIHLKLGNNRTPPNFPAPSLPTFLPLVFVSLFHICILFIALHYVYLFLNFQSHSAQAPASSLLPCFPSSLASPLSSMWASHRAPPPPLSSLPLSFCCALLQGTGRGKTKRLNTLDCTLPEENSGLILPSCVRQDYFVCLSCAYSKLNL